MTEKHRDLAINAVAVALASNGTGRPASAYLEVAAEVVDHVTAHAVETVRALAAAEATLQPEGLQSSRRA